MKKLTAITGLTVLFFSQLSMSSTLILPSPNEPDLLGTGGILDNIFGLTNLQRIDDEFDQYWNVSADEVTVTAVAKYAGFKQDFGFIDANDDYTSLLYVPYMNGQSNSFTIAQSGSPFRFGLDASGSPLFSSDPLDNVFCAGYFCSNPDDHMVSWLITAGQYAGDYVIAWEDLKGLGDRDYNDLVVRVSGITAVPIPAAAWLFGSGLLALVAAARGRRQD
jgi:Domain of unknown function (DUF4114)